MKIVFHSSIRRKANTVSSIFFWAGTSWIVSYLVAMTINWIVVFGSFVALIGQCIVVQSVVVLIAGAARRT